MKHLALTLLLTSTLAWGSYVIPLNAITTAKIADGAVTTSKVADGAITPAKIAARTASGNVATVGNVAMSLSSGDYSTTSASYVQPNNLSVTITTTGRPVSVFLISDGTFNGTTGGAVYSTGSSNGQCKIVRGGTDMAAMNLAPNYLPSSSFSAVDPVGAGTYTYTFQCLYPSGTGATWVVRSKLVAYEL